MNNSKIEIVHFDWLSFSILYVVGVFVVLVLTSIEPASGMPIDLGYPVDTPEPTATVMTTPTSTPTPDPSVVIIIVDSCCDRGCEKETGEAGSAGANSQPDVQPSALPMMNPPVGSHFPLFNLARTIKGHYHPIDLTIKEE